MQTIRLGHVRYDAGLGVFEARVDIERSGKTFRYPCRISGPATLDPDAVRDGLTSQALRMSDSGHDRPQRH